MKLKVTKDQLNDEVIDFLINHFNYSMKDVTSYKYLTDKEKEMISEEDFNNLVEDN